MRKAAHFFRSRCAASRSKAISRAPPFREMHNVYFDYARAFLTAGRMHNMRLSWWFIDSLYSQLKAVVLKLLLYSTFYHLDRHFNFLRNWQSNKCYAKHLTHHMNMREAVNDYLGFP